MEEVDRIQGTSMLSQQGNIPISPKEKYDESLRFTLYMQSGCIQNKALPENFPIDPFWLDVVNPTASELSQIATTFKIHPLTIEDVQVRDDREKCEMFEQYLFIVVRTVDESLVIDPWGRQIQMPVNVYIVLFSNSIVTIHHSILPCIPNVIYRLDRDKRFSELTTDWIMYTIMDDIVDEFMPKIKEQEMEADCIDDLVLDLSKSSRHEMLKRIGAAGSGLPICSDF
jgi:magnesium transporter